MKICIALFLLIAISHAIPEPEAINDQEVNDEIALAHQRASQIACLAVVRTKMIEHFAEISEILEKTPHDKELTRRRIIADIALRCSQEMTWEFAEELLMNNQIDLSHPTVLYWVKLNKDFYLNPASDMAWTSEHVSYFEKIDAVSYNNRKLKARMKISTQSLRKYKD
jgi:hypothetical protein